MLDFTSALYLGLDHPSSALARWGQLTLGKPAAMEAPPGSRELEVELAALTGCDRALLGPSTLHLFWDLFGTLAGRGVSIFLDEGSYPIARWGVERARACGTTVRTFSSHNVGALRSQLRRTGKKRPVVVTDGYCPACGSPAPLTEYLECLGSLDGLMVLDDTQSLGIYGYSQETLPPYGRGGGGSLRRDGVRDSRIVIVSSLAKAFGAPVAMIGGSEAFTAVFEQEGSTRIHCSPPSAAVIAATNNALLVNRQSGDTLRMGLARRVARFRRGLEGLNLIETKSMFPVQTLRISGRVGMSDLHQRLLDRGVVSVLHSGPNGASASISFVITARHTMDEIDRALASLADAIAGRRSKEWEGGKSDDSPFASASRAVRSILGEFG